jgi:hypothetical protein
MGYRSAKHIIKPMRAAARMIPRIASGAKRDARRNKDAYWRRDDKLKWPRERRSLRPGMMAQGQYGALRHYSTQDTAEQAWQALAETP